MKHIGAVLAIAGLALAVTLFAREDVGGIVALVIAAGPGLFLAALFQFAEDVPGAYGSVLHIRSRLTFETEGLLKVERDHRVSRELEQEIT